MPSSRRASTAAEALFGHWSRRCGRLVFNQDEVPERTTNHHARAHTGRFSRGNKVAEWRDIYERLLPAVKAMQYAELQKDLRHEVGAQACADLLAAASSPAPEEPVPLPQEDVAPPAQEEAPPAADDEEPELVIDAVLAEDQPAMRTPPVTTPLPCTRTGEEEALPASKKMRVLQEIEASRDTERLGFVTTDVQAYCNNNEHAVIMLTRDFQLHFMHQDHPLGVVGDDHFSLKIGLYEDASTRALQCRSVGEIMPMPMLYSGFCVAMYVLKDNEEPVPQRAIWVADVFHYKDDEKVILLPVKRINKIERVRWATKLVTHILGNYQTGCKIDDVPYVPAKHAIFEELNIVHGRNRPRKETIQVQAPEPERPQHQTFLYPHGGVPELDAVHVETEIEAFFAAGDVA
mmetsp:Transcript_29337/g.78765  ORF Transcript_29337/g.78765 Transcript_29337/m.78765 type:complete len:404 (-) Transcript_29337:416-1627(-)